MFLGLKNVEPAFPGVWPTDPQPPLHSKHLKTVMAHTICKDFTSPLSGSSFIGHLRNVGSLQADLIWFDLVWFGLVWFGVGWFGLSWFASSLSVCPLTILLLLAGREDHPRVCRGAVPRPSRHPLYGGEVQDEDQDAPGEPDPWLPARWVGVCSVQEAWQGGQGCTEGREHQAVV
jgi:hypothetical protein